MTNPFTEDYFMRGPDTGLSNYRDYSWRPDLTIPACQSIMRYMGIRPGDSLLDFGCARGFYVKGYRELGLVAFGYDVSDWAIANCDSDVAQYLNKNPWQTSSEKPDWIIAKDTLEHVIFKDLRHTIKFFLDAARKGALICVPLTTEDGGNYVLDVDNKDSTHVIRWTFHQWLEFLQEFVDDMQAPFVVTGGHRLPGLKEYGGLKHNGCGFFTLRRYGI